MDGFNPSCASRWLDRCMDGRDEWMHARMEGQMNRQMDDKLSGWLDEFIDGWMDEWTCR